MHCVAVLVTAEDIMEIDLDDHAIDPRGRNSFLERFIHSHAAAVIPFGVTDLPLKPISHMGSFLIRAVPVFQIREAGGEATDMRIRNAQLGAAVATKLGSAP